ncbi:MAG: hypothetical protein JNM40_22280 [Myxococcales bacterium]|nr:hypothetical protein [Myxococcales bacterium]
MAFDDVDPQTSGDGDSGYEAYDDYVDTDDQGGQDRDYDTVQYDDDRSDVTDQYNTPEYDDSDDADVFTYVNRAEKILDIAKPALKVLEDVVQRAGGDPRAVAALKTMQVVGSVAGDFTEYLGKKTRKNRNGDLDRVPVSVPTGGRRRSTTDAVRDALARMDD